MSYVNILHFFGLDVKCPRFSLDRGKLYDSISQSRPMSSQILSNRKLLHRPRLKNILCLIMTNAQESFKLVL